MTAESQGITAGMAETYYGFKHELERAGVILSYSGFVSEGILFALGETLRRKIEMEESDANRAKRLFSVFVEQVQNIIRYSAEKLPQKTEEEGLLGSGIVSVGTEGEAFFVVCANIVRRDRRQQLHDRLAKLASLDKEGLRSAYKEKLREPPEEESLGASLGLIEIARRSSRPIQFDFFDLDDQHCFFCLKAYV